jgi:biotin transport system substrate-specific component
MKEAIIDKSYVSPWLKNAISVLAGSVFLALMAQIAVPLPFSPVPISMQTFGVSMLGILLGSKLGAGAVLAYLCEATMGLPVIAGGAVNPLWIIGPRGGYLIGFFVAALCIGLVVRQFPKIGVVGLFLVCIMGELILHFFGWCELSLFLGMTGAFWAGVVPFMIPMIFKSSAAALLCVGIRKFQGSQL